MSRDRTDSRRGVLKATGGLASVGILGMLAGCGDGEDGEDGDGGTPTETEGDIEAVSIGGTEEPSNGTETAEATGTASIRRRGPGDSE